MRCLLPFGWPADRRAWLQVKSNVAYYTMLTKVYKELMILGFIGFCVIMLKEQGYSLNPATMHCFEFCDLIVTICVLLYVGCTLISSFGMHMSRREWDRISMTSVEKVCHDVDVHLEEVETSVFAKGQHILSSEWRREAEFKLVELLFKTKFHLGRDFDYMMYAKAVLEVNVVDLANISTYHWLTICGISLAIYFSAPGTMRPEDFLGAFSETVFTPEGGTEDPGGSQRRALGGAENAACEAALPCGLNATELQLAVDELVLASGNATNATSAYNETCACSSDVQHTAVTIDVDMTYWSIVGFGAFGWCLVLLQHLVNWSLKRRMNLILKYHGATDSTSLTTLLKHLDAHFGRHLDEQVESIVDVGDDSNGNASDDEEEDEHHIMVFHRENKDANDVLSWRAFGFLMFVAKLVQLINCFYLGFYMCHMNMRLQLVQWQFLSGIGFDDADPGSLSVARTVVHIWLVIPIFVIIFRQLPRFTKDISLLIGVLHLHEPAVNAVIQHMEVVKQIRKRIKKRLERTRILTGKKKVKRGMKRLDLVRKGECKILVKLQKLRRDGKTRVNRDHMETWLQDQNTDTDIADLEAFLSREAFAAYLKEAPCDQATAQTARTLSLCQDTMGRHAGGKPGGDTITIDEFTTFLVWAIAAACNAADENGVGGQIIDEVRALGMSLAGISAEAFAAARLLARTKSLFRAVDTDRSGQVSKKELAKAFRRYRVPISAADMEIIMRIIDPDQSGQMSMEEWLDFMLATDENLTKATLKASGEASRINAEKGGDGFLDIRNYAAEALSVVPGGDAIVSTVKDPLGTVQNVSAAVQDAVNDPIGAINEAAEAMVSYALARVYRCCVKRCCLVV